MAFPELIENTEDLRDVESLVNWARERCNLLKSTLAESGAILFRGFPVSSPEEFDAFSAAFGYGDFTYKESLSNAVRINLTPRIFTANEAPPEVEIFLHHEMAQTPIFPQKLFFCCLAPAQRGGATPICRSDELFSAFAKSEPAWAEQFRRLGLKYTTHMPSGDDPTSGQGRSWRSTLSVSTPEEAEARLAELEYTWTWMPDESLLATTPTLPAVRRLRDGRESFFNQVIASHLGWKRQQTGKPVLAFGNGEEIPQKVLDGLVELSRSFIYPIDWQEGDVALLDNYRVMHGRYSYSGARKRQVLVCLAREDD